MSDIYSQVHPTLRGKHLHEQLRPSLRGTIKRDASDNPAELNAPNSNTLINNGAEPAREGSSPVNLMRRFPHLAQPTNNAPYQSPYSPYLPRPASQERIIMEATPATVVWEGAARVDISSETHQVSTGISWHSPHPKFVIILVGQHETPFGIHKDLLCAQSPYYRFEFAEVQDDKVEFVVKLLDTNHLAFGCFQNFIYTGEVYDKRGRQMVPDYRILLWVWKLATKLLMPSLRVAVLGAMAERRQQLGFVPRTTLYTEAWSQTEEGSGLRKMLIEWAAEHMRSNPQERNDFVRSLPKEILSDLVIALSDMPADPADPTNHSIDSGPAAKRSLLNNPAEEMDLGQAQQPRKRSRKSATDPVNSAPDEVFEVKPAVKKSARKSEPSRRVSRRVSAPPPPAAADHDNTFTPEKELEYCRDLIKRMVSGPGYWTRYVTNFKKPVDPVMDNAPNYSDVVKKPMCLNLMKTKMENGEYSSGAEFEADIRLIFQNCYEYWTPADPIWKECDAFEEFFNNQWAQRSTYASGKRVNPVKAEIID